MSGSSSGGRQSGAVLYSAFGVMGEADNGVRIGVSKSNGSSGSQTGSGYSTDVSDDNLPNDGQSPASEPNNNSDSDEQVLICCSLIVNGHLRSCRFSLGLCFSHYFSLFVCAGRGSGVR